MSRRVTDALHFGRCNDRYYSLLRFLYWLFAAWVGGEMIILAAAIIDRQ